MNYQILFCDLDGTLLRSDKALAPATRAALERAVRQGVEFVPATGRFFSGMPAVVRELPFLRYAVLMNGALVYDRLEDRALRRAELAPETAVRVMKRFVKCFFELLTQILVKVRKCKVQRVCVLHFQLAGSGGCFFLMKLYH